MTNYQFTPASILSSPVAQQAKQQRKQQLEAIRKRRYQQEQAYRKRQQKAYSTSEEYREYQETFRQPDS